MWLPTVRNSMSRTLKLVLVLVALAAVYKLVFQD